MSDSAPTPDREPVDSPPSREANAADTDRVDRLEALWERGTIPDLTEVRRISSGLAGNQLGALLRFDQRARWNHGVPALIETYLSQFPEMRADREVALDLVFQEYLIRRRKHERIDVSLFVERFPGLEDELRAQIALYEALQPDSGSAASSTDSSALAGVVGGAEGESDLGPLPRQFGRYQLLDVLGRGGMGVVYRGYDPVLGREVAIKIPEPSHPASVARKARFLREARIAASLHHPRLCPVFDYGMADGLLFLTMPVLSGESLADRIRRLGRLPVEQAARLIQEAAEVVAVAHMAGIVHRDLKPSNIWLDREDGPILMDFGLARWTESADETLTATGDLLGTPRYLPPEWVGALSKPHPAGDVYSLGVVLYECLTGQGPFPGPATELLRQTLTQPPTPPSEHVQDLSPQLEAVCLKALAKQPEDRFASMADFGRAIATALDEQGRPKSTFLHAWKSRAAVVCVGLIALLLVALVLSMRSPRTVRSARSTHSETPSDLLQPGTLWYGMFTFHPPFQGTDRLRIEITSRDGQHFEGEYESEVEYAWIISGTIDGTKIHWGFDRALHGEGTEKLVGKGSVEGTIAGDVIQGRFFDPNDGSSASLEVRLRR